MSGCFLLSGHFTLGTVVHGSIAPVTKEQDERFYLSGILHDIASIAGKEAAIAVCKSVGGTRVYLPCHPEHDHWLTKIVGYECAIKICENIVSGKTGVEVEIPLSSTGTITSARKKAREQIDASFRQGHDVTTAARQAGVHIRTVQRRYSLLKASEIR